MGKKIDIVVADETYTLEFTRAAYASMEQAGFRLDNVDGMPLTSAYMLFWGSLRKNHPHVSLDKSNEIFDTLIEDGYEMSDILNGLVELMNEVFTSSNKTKKKVKVLKG